jgi:hypothetical protein
MPPSSVITAELERSNAQPRHALDFLHLPAIVPPINSARNASTLAPISTVVRTSISVAVARIAVRTIVAGIRRGVGVAWVTRIVGGVTTVGWITTVGGVTRTDVDVNALGGCLHRHKHRQARATALIRMADDFLIAQFLSPLTI